MFTGLVEDTAEVTDAREAGGGKRIRLSGSKILGKTSNGESVSVSGACLTVEESTENGAVFFLAEETLEKTWFSRIEEGDELNLERALKPSERMGGHIVQGHVEGAAEVIGIEELEEGWNFRFSLPEVLERYVVEKGFITVEGVSLTVTEADRESFSVTIIPETWEVTNFSGLEEEDPANIETDVTARHIEKFTGRYG